MILTKLLLQTSKMKAALLEHMAALEDAQHQLQVLSAQATLTPEELDAFQNQQRIRELESTIELSQHECATEQQRTEVILFNIISVA